MNRVEKQEFVADLKGRLEGQELMVVTHYRGCSVSEMEDLRTRMRAEGVQMQVSKNRLAKLAMASTDFADISDMMKGPTALAFSADPVSAAKVAQKFADENDSFEVIGGAMGEKRLEAADVKELSKLPSLDELRGKLVGLLQAPATKLAGVTQAPAGQLARLIAQKPEAA